MRGYSGNWADLNECALLGQDLYERCNRLTFKIDEIYANPNILPRKRVMYIRGDAYLIFMELAQLERKVLKVANDVRALAPKERESLTRRIEILMSVLVSLGILFSFVLVRFFTREFVDRLKSIENKFDLMALEKPLPPQLAGNDEFSALDSVLHESAEILADTRRKELAVVDNVADVVASIDKRMRFVALNQATHKLWNYSPEELLGQPISFLVDRRTLDETRSSLEKLMKSGESAEIENTVKSKTGDAKDTLWSVRWSTENQAFYCVAHDITQQRSLDRMKQRFVAVAGHDIRTPLTSISSSLSLLHSGARGALQKNTEDILAEAEGNVNRLMDLIRELLDLEKLESGSITLKFSGVSALDVCSAAADSLEALAAKSKVTVKKPSGDALIRGDEERLIQAMTHLLSKAIITSRENSSVEMSIKSLGQMVEIKIRKQGSAVSESADGASLSMAFVNAIAEAHGGTIGETSEMNDGSAFWMSIPVFEDKDKSA